MRSAGMRRSARRPDPLPVMPPYRHASISSWPVPYRHGRSPYRHARTCSEHLPPPPPPGGRMDTRNKSGYDGEEASGYDGGGCPKPVEGACPELAEGGCTAAGPSPDLSPQAGRGDFMAALHSACLASSPACPGSQSGACGTASHFSSPACPGSQSGACGGDRVGGRLRVSASGGRSPVKAPRLGGRGRLAGRPSPGSSRKREGGDGADLRRREERNGAAGGGRGKPPPNAGPASDAPA